MVERDRARDRRPRLRARRRHPGQLHGSDRCDRRRHVLQLHDAVQRGAPGGPADQRPVEPQVLHQPLSARARRHRLQDGRRHPDDVVHERHEARDPHPGDPDPQGRARLRHLRDLGRPDGRKVSIGRPVVPNVRQGDHHDGDRGHAPARRPRAGRVPVERDGRLGDPGRPQRGGQRDCTARRSTRTTCSGTGGSRSAARSGLRPTGGPVGGPGAVRPGRGSRSTLVPGHRRPVSLGPLDS